MGLREVALANKDANEDKDADESEDVHKNK